MSVASAISKRSRCYRRQIGAVIVTRTNRPVAVGYNGPPAGLDTDGNCRNWCQRTNEATPGAEYSNCVSIHAEVNALLFADRRDFDGGTIYVTSVCCWDCAKVIANSGLSRVVLANITESDMHRNPERSIQLLRDSGVKVEIMR